MKVGDVPKQRIGIHQDAILVQVDVLGIDARFVKVELGIRETQQGTGPGTVHIGVNGR